MYNYDYVCPECGHEFDYQDGEIISSRSIYVECPFCKKFIEKS